MCPSHRLEKLQGRATRRLSRLRPAVDSLGLPLTAEKDRAIAWTVIEARNLWAEFLRAYFLSGAMRTFTISGASVSFLNKTFTDSQAALRYSALLTGHSKPGLRVTRQVEPAWHDVSKYLKLCNDVGFSNMAQIRAAFAYQTQFFEQLTPIRNFYSHRCDEAFRKAAQVGIKLGLSASPDLRPAQILSSKLPTRPQNIITDWLDDIGNVIEILCE